MSLDVDELAIRKFLAQNLITPIMPTGGRVIPAPVYFNDKEDYWATIESVSYGTQLELEQAHVLFVCLYFVNFVDLEKTPPEAPLFGLIYELYVFSQYDLLRSDENISPDAFNKLMLAKHNAFVKLCLNLKEQFQGRRDMGILDPTVYAVQKTTSLVQNERVTNKGKCEFVPDILGHQAKFQETVWLKNVAC